MSGERFNFGSPTPEEPLQPAAAQADEIAHTMPQEEQPLDYSYENIAAQSSPPEILAKDDGFPALFGDENDRQNRA